MNLKSFLRDCRGNVAMIFALSAVPLLGMAAGAVDYQMATAERSHMQDALDAATLEVVTHGAGGTRADREARLQASYAANGGRGTARIAQDIDSGASQRDLATTAEQSMQTNILGVIGIPQMDLGVDAAAVRVQELQSAQFRLISVNGYFNKRITLWGRYCLSLKSDAGKSAVAL